MRNKYRKSKILSVLENYRDKYLSVRDIFLLLNEQYTYTTVKNTGSLGQILRSYKELEKIKTYDNFSHNEIFITS
jgi:hypothetical protein